MVTDTWACSHALTPSYLKDDFHGKVITLMFAYDTVCTTASYLKDYFYGKSKLRAVHPKVDDI